MTNQQSTNPVGEPDQKASDRFLPGLPWYVYVILMAAVAAVAGLLNAAM